jgi:hypothetical protein
MGSPSRVTPALQHAAGARRVAAIARRIPRLAAMSCALLVALAGMCASALAAGAPVIENESAKSVEYVGATLQAHINPKESATTYRFEYGTDGSYGSAVPVHDAEIGAGTEAVSVVQALAGLQAGAAYHYRVVAVNAEGAVYGQDKLFKTYPAPSQESDACLNANVRAAQFASYLPDCRAYEMVSPLHKNGGNVSATATMTQSSAGGDAVKYTATVMLPGATGTEQRGAEYTSQRGSEGWATREINPNQEAKGVELFMSAGYEYLSDDLSHGVYYASTPVTAGHSNVEGVSNLYLRSNLLSTALGEYQLLSDSATPLGSRAIFQRRSIDFAGASADDRHILFESIDNLTPEATGLDPEAPKVYEWKEGVLTLAGILPGGEPAESSLAGRGAGVNDFEGGKTYTRQAISADGSRVVFTAPPFSTSLTVVGGKGAAPAGSAGALYMRIDSDETVQLNESERSEPDPNGRQPAAFWTATADDSRVFFSTNEALTDDAVPGRVGLYEYQMGAPVGERLTLIAMSRESGSGNNLYVNGVSADGDYVYFTTQQPLRPEDPGAEVGDVYVWHEGSLRFITTRDEASPGIIGVSVGSNTEGWGEARVETLDGFRVTPNGKRIAFVSRDLETARRAGAENAPPGSEEQGYPQVYTYDYESGKISCASCSPGNAQPAGNAGFNNDKAIDGDAFFGEGAYTTYLSHALSDDGRFVFFDTPSVLLPQDTNGHRDVYEYDTSSGQLHLISSGTCDCNSFFTDASPDGRNVFFTTYQRLVRADIDLSADLYDARIEGGILVQNEPVSAVCVGDDCQGPVSSAPGFSLPSSMTFAGVGNPGAQPRVSGGQVKRKVKKHKAKKHRSKYKHKRARKGGHAARGALRRAGR